MFYIVINPSSSSGRGLRSWKKIEPLFVAHRNETGENYRVFFSSPKRSIESIVRKLTSYDRNIRLVILGGDGTINEAVNGICDFRRVQLGYIPIGSGNDFAKGLGLSRDLIALTRTILRGETVRSIDVGEVTFNNRSDILDPRSHNVIRDGMDPRESGVKRRFVVSAGIGYDAEICQRAMVSPAKAALNKVHLGKLIYIAEASRLILTTPMLPYRVRYSDDTRLRYSKTLFVVCMNQRFEGGGFMFCPDASDRDGKLDLCIAAGLRNRLSFFYIFPTIYGGHHRRFPVIHTARSGSVSIKTPLPMWVHTDGEVSCRSTHIDVSTLQEVLHLMM